MKSLKLLLLAVVILLIGIFALIVDGRHGTVWGGIGLVAFFAGIIVAVIGLIKKVDDVH